MFDLIDINVFGLTNNGIYSLPFTKSDLLKYVKTLIENVSS